MLKKFPYIFGLVWVVVLFVIPLPLIQALAAGLPGRNAADALAIQLGSVAYVWFLTAIYLSTRPKWLDRLIGLPNIYFIHGVLSLFAIGLAFIHKTNLHSHGLIQLTGNWAFDLFIGVMVYSLVFMAGWFTAHLKVIAQLKKVLEHVFHHELTIWIHRLNIVAVVLVFIHVELIGYITSIHAYMALFYLYSGFTLVAYLVKKLRDYRFLPVGHLVEKRALKDNFYKFKIKVGHLKWRKIQPGDYVFIKVPNVRGLRELHPFSVVNKVGEDGVITLAIRGDGDFTRQIQSLELGELIQFDGGYGRFNTLITQNDGDQLVLATGGTGIVPMLAIIDAHPERLITLFYTVHTAADQIYVTQLEHWAATRATLTVHVQTGRFTPATELQKFTGHRTTFLISGPYALGQSWVRALRQRRIAASKYYYEEFNW
ncbi:FAD-binding oxidoreductase [Secundilactobacillus paracollinoides]|uniref:Oxidoreductase n=2 Tax=Secundilactobacillus paracollinoides TaxID=240427 RepID=A0A1B2J0D5_9LACO|nr:FAD-binding oxidoreductase [Secundilactobacillus paracollinoides]ANZ61884.1 oxidoreductase [Secundilactobacillus paracollinoides]ANZ67804.1 oxidoreductase [Secundilactobacillus paracollinoides]KRL75714.1 ferric reductase [Secundilactobacillus paracollinoides DSM 15502 = JCM 11969]